MLWALYKSKHRDRRVEVAFSDLKLRPQIKQDTYFWLPGFLPNPVIDAEQYLTADLSRCLSSCNILWPQYLSLICVFQMVLYTSCPHYCIDSELNSLELASLRRIYVRTKALGRIHKQVCFHSAQKQFGKSMGIEA